MYVVTALRWVTVPPPTDVFVLQLLLASPGCSHQVLRKAKSELLVVSKICKAVICCRARPDQKAKLVNKKQQASACGRAACSALATHARPLCSSTAAGGSH